MHGRSIPQAGLRSSHRRPSRHPSFGGLLRFVLLLFLLAPTAAAQTQEIDSPEPLDRTSLTRAELSMDDRLIKAVRYLGSAPTPKAGYASLSRDALQVDGQGRLLVTIEFRASSARIIDQVQSVGGTIVSNHVADYRFLDCWLPYHAVTALALDPLIRQLSAISRPLYGSTTTEGDNLHGAEGLRLTRSCEGWGVKVGVISNGIQHLSQAQDSADLPSCVTNVGPSSAGDEGTAMLEIIHDLAPAANLLFHASGGSPGTMIDALEALRAAGCDVIVDDVMFRSEPFFEDGPTADAWDAAAQNGVVVVSSAGNFREAHRQEAFHGNGPFTYGTQSFTNPHVWQGQSAPFLALTLPKTGSVVLQWTDRWGQSAHDLNIFVFDAQNQHVVSSGGTSPQTGSQDPIEIAYLNLGSGTFAAIVVVDGPVDPGVQIETYFLTSDGRWPIGDLSRPDDSSFGHASAVGTISCASSNADWFPLLTAEYSSMGPVSLLGEDGQLHQRAKPDLTGCDCVRVSGAGGFGDPGGPNYRIFCGTSAAAPHIAALAALALDADPTLTPDNVRSRLTSVSTPIEDWDHGGAGAPIVNGWTASALHFPEHFTDGGTVKHQAINTIDLELNPQLILPETPLPILSITPYQQSLIDRLLGAELLLDVDGLGSTTGIKVCTQGGDILGELEQTGSECRTRQKIRIPARMLVESGGTIPLVLKKSGVMPAWLYSASLRVLYIQSGTEAGDVRGGWSCDPQEPWGTSITYSPGSPPHESVHEWTAPAIGSATDEIKSARVTLTVKGLPAGDCYLGINGVNVGTIQAPTDPDRVETLIFTVPVAQLSAFLPGQANAMRLDSGSPFTLYGWDVSVDVRRQTDDALLTFSPRSIEAPIPSSFVVDLQVARVADLDSVATDVRFDPAVIRCVGIAEETFLSEGGTVQTSLVQDINNSLGIATISLARSGESAHGVSTDSPATVARLSFAAASPGTTGLQFENTFLGKPDHTPIPSLVDPGTVAIGAPGQIGFLAALPAYSERQVGEEFELSICVSNLSDLYAFAGDVVYSPGHLVPIAVEESGLLNQGGTAPTLFDYDIDTNQGRIILSVTRLGQTAGVDVSTQREVARVRFRSQGTGTSNIGFENVGLLAPDGATSYEHSTYGATVSAIGSGQAVDCFFYPQSRSVGLPETFDLQLCTGPVTGLHALAATITFDPSILALEDVIEDGFLSAAGSEPTSFMEDVTQASGRAIIGLTRLAHPASGVSSQAVRNPMVTLRFRSLRPGSATVAIPEVGLLGPDGVTSYTATTQTATILVGVPEVNAAVGLFPDGASWYRTESGYVDVFVRDVANLFALAGEIHYDPARISIASATEGNFLNESGEARTALLWQDDGQGKITFGATRLESDLGVDANGDAWIARFHFVGESAGAGAFSLANVGLLAPDGTTPYSFTVAGAEFTILEPPYTTLQPGPGNGKDAYVRSSQANANYGSSAVISVRHTPETMRGLIQFGLTGFSPATVVLQSQLGIYCGAITESATAELRKLLSSWDEPAVTWQNCPPSGSPLGAFGLSAVGWCHADMTAAVRDWIATPASNNGILLNLQNESGTVGADFVSSDSLEFSSAWPYLTLQYFVPHAPTGRIQGVVTSSQTGLPIGGVSLGLFGLLSSSTVTNANGEYVFEAVPEGVGYRLQASKNGYQPSTVDFVTMRNGLTTTADISLGEDQSWTQFAWHLAAGWNLLSLSVVPDAPHASAIFPGNTGSLRWDGAYSDADSNLTAGTGFWIRMPAPATVPASGWSQPDVSVHVETGWNLIGGPCDLLAMSDIQQNPAGSILDLYRFDGRYHPTSVLSPGAGYWVKTSRPCTLRMFAPGKRTGELARQVPLREARQSALLDTPLLAVFGGQSRVDTLWFGLDPEATSGLDVPLRERDLPPTPPPGVADFRFDLGGGLTSLRDIRSGIDGATYVFTWQRGDDLDYAFLAWDPSVLPDSLSWTLQDRAGGQFLQIDMREENVVLLTGSLLDLGTLEIDAEMSASGPNGTPAPGSRIEDVRPNPIIGESELAYEVPRRTHVAVSVVDILGRRVHVIEDRVVDAGRHRCRWNPRNSSLGSGTYFLVMDDGTHRFSRKVTVLR